VLDGGNGAPRAIVLLNAAAALYAADAVPTIGLGIQLAADVIDSGAAREKLEALVSLTRRMGVVESAVA
jgi:anthranilate phosphoribosyltransferase